MMRTSIRLLSDGVIKFDGGAMFGQIPKATWESRVSVDRKNRITMGLNCLLLQCADKNILIDAGVGSKEMNGMREEYGIQPSRLLKGLKDIGLTSKDIDVVVLTHLHFDHSGGCTRLDRAGNLVPTFSRATYYVQKQCWEEANNPNERCKCSYRPEDFRPLSERGQLVLLDGDTEILPGIWCKVTNGHTQGHQIVMIKHGGERIAVMGDLVPTAYHLDLSCIPAFDRVPEETYEQKRELLDQAEKDGWLLVFSHGYDHKAGYLERRSGHRYLRPVEI